MQTEGSSTNQNGVQTAGEQKRLAFVEEVRVLVPASAFHTDGECACVRIHHAKEILRELLLSDDLAHGNTLLVGVAAERIDEIVRELDQLAGLQRMFELFVNESH